MNAVTIPQWRDGKNPKLKPEAFSALAEEYIDNISGSIGFEKVFTYDGFLAWYRQKTGKPFNLRKIGVDDRGSPCCPKGIVSSKTW